MNAMRFQARLPVIWLWFRHRCVTTTSALLTRYQATLRLDVEHYTRPMEASHGRLNLVNMGWRIDPNSDIRSYRYEESEVYEQHKKATLRPFDFSFNPISLNRKNNNHAILLLNVIKNSLPNMQFKNIILCVAAIAGLAFGNPLAEAV